MQKLKILSVLSQTSLASGAAKVTSVVWTSGQNVFRALG